MQQDRRRNAVDNAFSFPAADVGCDQQVLGRTGRHSLIPGNHRDGQRWFEQLNKRFDDFGRRPAFAVQSERHADENLSNLVLAHQALNVPNIGIGIPPVKRFQRLGRPPELIAQGKPDPFGTVIDRENPLAFHQSTLPRPFGPTQKFFPAPDPACRDFFRRPAPSRDDRHLCRRLRSPSP